MKTFKFIANTYINKKTNQPFMKFSCKGQFLPLLKAENDIYYNINFITKLDDDVFLPKKEGIYSVACKDNRIWLDNRKDMIEKHIVRCEPLKIIFEKELEHR